MELDNLISALEKTLAYLQNSQSSDYTHMSVEEIIGRLESELAKVRNSDSIDTKLISFVYAPTGAIQETSIDNGWGDEFLRISEIVDRYTDI